MKAMKFEMTDTLYHNIATQIGEIQNELDWLKHYRRQKDVECMEDCVRNITNTLTAITESIEHLKGEKL